MDGTYYQPPIFTPDPRRAAASQLADFIRFCSDSPDRDFANQTAFHEFSTKQFRTFWRRLLDWSDLPVDGDAHTVCTDDLCESARFFPDLRLNYAEVLLAGDPTRPALVTCHRDAPVERLSRGELRGQVARLAASLLSLGVVAGDRIAAIARNDAATVVACLAAAAIGASFAVAPPEMGEEAILGRFTALSPRVLFAHSAGQAGLVDRIAAVAAALPSLVVVITLTDEPPPRCRGISVLSLPRLTGASHPALHHWARLPFNHPLFILFSSGTTGAPKCIVHGAGGTLLEHIKEHRLHCDLSWGSRLFFHTSCAWMMWNWQLSALASGAEIVLYDGPVSGADTLWRIAADHRVTHFGTSPPYLKLCEDQGYQPARRLDLSSLSAVMSTGSVLHDHQYDWFARSVGRIPLQSISGGTDIIGCFVLGSPLRPIWRGEAQCISLGMDVRAVPVAEDTRPGYGELVCANPFPSRPLHFLGDTDGDRFHRAYFAQHPGVWTHGDFIELTSHGTARIHGRSDGVMNIRGIRIGPAEIYRVLQEFPEVAQALAVAQVDENELGGFRLVLLLTTAPGMQLTPEVAMQIRRTLGAKLTPTHVPAAIVAVLELPVTHSGKLSEEASRAALNGEAVRNRQALRNPHCLDQIAHHPALRRHRSLDRVMGELTPDMSLEAKLTSIWEELFAIAPIRSDDDFFQLGGDSLMALTLMAAIEEATGQDLAISVLLEVRSIAGLAALLRDGVRQGRLIQARSGTGASVFMLPGLSGTCLEQHRLVARIAERPVYTLQARGVEGSEEPLVSVRDIANSYIAAIRNVQPHGPYVLVGFSFGALVAYEIARLFAVAGEAIEHVILLDPPIHPGALPPGLQLQRRLRQIGAIRSGLRRHRGLPALHYVARELHGVFSALRVRFGGAPGPGITDMMDLPPSLRQVHLACEQAFMTYRPESYAGPVLLLHATRRDEREVDPLPLWRRLVPLLEVEDIEAPHLGLIEDPAVVQVARALNRRLMASPLDAAKCQPPPPLVVAANVVAANVAAINETTVADCGRRREWPTGIATTQSLPTRFASGSRQPRPI
jgi:acetoacetyl-CoA synthetase